MTTLILDNISHFTEQLRESILSSASSFHDWSKSNPDIATITATALGILGITCAVTPAIISLPLAAMFYTFSIGLCTSSFVLFVSYAIDQVKNGLTLFLNESLENPSINCGQKNPSKISHDQWIPPKKPLEKAIDPISELVIPAIQIALFTPTRDFYRPKRIDILEETPSCLLKIFSFLKDEERACARCVRKKWNIFVLDIPPQTTAEKNDKRDLIHTIDQEVLRKTVSYMNDHLAEMPPQLVDNLLQERDHDTQAIDVLERHSFMLRIFSFLSAQEKETARCVSKKWDLVSDIPSQKSIVENGYGDFILLNTTSEEISRDVFQRAFFWMNHYLPQVHQKPVRNRLRKVDLHVQTLHPHLKVVFIPRVLYELYYLLGTALEELDLTSKKSLGCNKETICWHGSFFSEWTDKNNLNPKIIEIAYRLNHLIIKELNVTPQGLTEQQCKQAGRSLLQRFENMDREFHEKCLQTCPSEIDIFRGAIKRFNKMMIDPINLDQAIALECSKKARNSLILYRGSRFKKEPLYEKLFDNTIPYSSCYGTSLFAGFLNDPNACANVRMCYDSSTVRAYGMCVSLTHSWQDTFFVPPANTICGLNGIGERFHARSKCVQPKDVFPTRISGYACEITKKISEEIFCRLVSPLPEAILRKKFDHYLNTSIEFINIPGRDKGYS